MNYPFQIEEDPRYIALKFKPGIFYRCYESNSSLFTKGSVYLCIFVGDRVAIVNDRFNAQMVDSMNSKFEHIDQSKVKGF